MEADEGRSDREGFRAVEQRRMAAQVLSDPELLLMHALSRQDVRFFSFNAPSLYFFFALNPLSLPYPLMPPPRHLTHHPNRPSPLPASP